MNEFEIRDKLKIDRKEIKSFDDLVNFLKEAREYNVDYGGAPRAIAHGGLLVILGLQVFKPAA
jgi:hypothetical protein